MKIFVGVKKVDHLKIKSLVPKSVEFIIWPNEPEIKKTLSHDELNLSQNEPNCYIHYSGYKKLSLSEIGIFSGRCLNIHPAPPSYPGIGGINWALYYGENTFGITLHIMGQKIDQGPIINVSKFQLDPKINIIKALKILFKKRTALLVEVVNNLSSEIDFTQLTKQKDSSSYFWGDKMFLRRELDTMQIFEIDSNFSKKELNRRIRAFHTNDYPLKIKVDGTYFSLNQI